MKHTHNNPPPTYPYNTLQLLFLTTYYKTTNEYTDEFPLYKVPHYIKRKKHPSHDNYLYRRWTNPTVHKHKTKKTRTNASLSNTAAPRMIRSLPPQSKPSAPLTHEPNTQPTSILLPSLVLRFGINQYHSTKYPSNPTPVTNPDIPVL